MKKMDAVLTNKPNMSYIMGVLCEQLSRQNGGVFEYGYVINEKEEKSSDE